MAVDVGSAIGYLDIDISGFLSGLETALNQTESSKNKIEALGGKISGVGDKFQSVGSSLTKNVTVPLVAVGTAGLKVATDFEKAMSEVSAITGEVAGETGSQFDSLRDKAIDLGATTAFSATEVAGAMTEMAKAGWTADDILSGMSGVLDATAASGESLATVSTIMADALTGFGLEAGKAGDVANLLTQAANSGTIGINDLGESFKYIAPVAQSLGLNITDVTTALAVMSKAGIKGSQAGTSLRTTLTNLVKPTDAMATAMEELGIEVTNSDGTMKSLDSIVGVLRDSFSGLTDEQKAYYAATLAGKEGMSGLLALLNLTEEEYNAVAASMEDCTDVAKNTAATMQDNLQSKLEQLGGALESLAIIMADNVIPALTTFIEWLTGLVEKFTELSPGAQKFILILAGIAIAIGPVISIVGKLISGFGGIVSIIGKASSLFGGFASVASTAATPIGSAGRSTAKMAAAAKNLISAGAGILLAATGMALLAQSAIALSEAGLPAVGCMVLMVGAMAALGTGVLYLTKTTASIRGLAKASNGLLAAGAGILMAAGGLALLAQSAIAIADAGWPAAAALAGLVAALAGLAIGAAAIGPALTAGAVGLVAFGGAIALVGVGILAATSGVALLATQLPTIAQYGSQAATALFELGGGLLSLGGGALAAGAGLVVAGAGLTAVAIGAGAAAIGVAALGVGVLALAAGAITLGAGLTLCGAGLTLMAATGQTAASGMASLAVAATAAFVPIAAGAVSCGVLDVALLSLMIPLAALTLELAASAASCGLLSAAMESTATSVTTIESSAASAAQSLSEMVTSVDIVKAGLDGLGASADAAIQWVVNSFTAGGPTASAAALAMATGITTNMQVGLEPIPANTTATITAMNGVVTMGMTQFSTTVITHTNMSAMAVMTGVNQMNMAVTIGMAQMNNTVRTGFASAVAYIKSLAGQAYGWGADMMQGLINGIYSRMGALRAAVNQAASIIHANLHFSRPDEGPLRDYETWMPDFMEGLAKGINSNLYQIEGAVGNVADRMVIKPEYSADQMFSVSATNELKEYNITLVNTLELYRQLVEQLKLCSMYSLSFRSGDNELLKVGVNRSNTPAVDVPQAPVPDTPNKPDQLVIPITIGEEQIETVVVDLLKREVRI